VKPEADYIKESIDQLNEALSQIPDQYAKIQRHTDREIDLLCEEAGIMGKVKILRVTHMYGILLESLDPMSRLKLMHGKLEDEGWAEMVQVLGGDYTRRDWDGTDPGDWDGTDPEPPLPALEHTSMPSPPEPEEHDVASELPDEELVFNPPEGY
jgi:hypothetical protein